MGLFHHQPRTFLFVHGAWHTAAHWNKVAEQLTEQGHRVHALDLRAAP